MLYGEACLWFARGILEQKRRTRRESLYVVGVTGSIGRGKSTFCKIVAQHLNEALSPGEGQSIVRSLDDYYLPKAERNAPDFLARGYAPLGISNRGPAGTHDIHQLTKDIEAFERSTADSTFALMLFDKQADDRAPIPLTFTGKIGILLLEGWFVGAAGPANPSDLPPGLKRSVAVALGNYQPVFDRLDGLWAFDPLPTDQVASERLGQEQEMGRQSGRAGMNAEEVSRFVHYCYEASWLLPYTSPNPRPDRVSFWASMDKGRQEVIVRPGLRTAEPS